MPAIDINCDLGEGFPHDAELMTLITSANVCCGAHAGGKDESRAAVELAARHGVAVGAHPGYPDRAHFGRRPLNLSPEFALQECSRQISTLVDMAEAAGTAVRYVKPHGALYHQAFRDDALAQAVAGAAYLYKLPVVGTPGSILARVARKYGGFIGEGFADRAYRADGSLVPRDQPGAFITDPAQAAVQAEDLAVRSGVRSICVHGDNPQAVEFVRALREAFLKSGWELRAFAE